jgi:hypothetical protein
MFSLYAVTTRNQGGKISSQLWLQRAALLQAEIIEIVTVNARRSAVEKLILPL